MTVEHSQTQIPEIVQWIKIHWWLKNKAYKNSVLKNSQFLITLRSQSLWLYMTLLPVTLSVLDEGTCADFENSLYGFGQSEKR